MPKFPRTRKVLVTIVAVFGVAIWLGLFYGVKEVSLVAVGALATMSNKLVQSDEVTERVAKTADKTK